jgi:hypothetical protein
LPIEIWVLIIIGILIVEMIDWVRKPCCFSYVVVNTCFNLGSSIIGSPIQRFITFRYHYCWSQQNLLVLLSSLADVFSTPLFIPSKVLGLRHGNPVQDVRLGSRDILNLCRGGRGHHILIDRCTLDELVVALDILKRFQIEGIFGHPNSISEISSSLNPRVGVRRLVWLTSKRLCRHMV